MRVLVQWTKLNPEDWVELDVRNTGPFRKAWENLPAKPLPAGGEAIDNALGWVFDINVQGIHFGGSDHYAVEPTAGGVRVTTWNDDSEDYPPGTRFATRWDLLDPALDPAVGQVNTRQTRTMWHEDQTRFPDALPWSQFVPPPAAVTRHGIWLPEALMNQHLAARQSHGWREWIV